ncbi:apolipoprotein a1 a4 e [Lasius niger]|uniref:Apolipoprotein a1 a4 e n=1 Tax=Lasius niger TaxID=67767 RepID=A0A0J7JU93_LASNI|nr:apolipoprotein a1 a4 e [Lasius niger]
MQYPSDEEMVQKSARVASLKQYLASRGWYVSKQRDCLWCYYRRPVYGGAFEEVEGTFEGTLEEIDAPLETLEEVESKVKSILEEVEATLDVEATLNTCMSKVETLI